MSRCGNRFGAHTINRGRHIHRYLLVCVENYSGFARLVAALADAHAQNSRRWVHQHTGLRQSLLAACCLGIAESAVLRRGNRVIAITQATDSMVCRARKGITPA